MNKQRLDYLDMAKGIGILFVLIGHLQGDPYYTYSPYIQPLCIYIFAFHMPMFFIVSGILMAIKHTDNKPIKETIGKRFKGIMIPYFWFSFFYLLVVVWALIVGDIQVQTLYLNLWYVLSGYGMNVLWFLPALFLGELLFIWLRQKFPNNKIFIIIEIAISAIVFVIGYLLIKYDTNPDAAIYKRFREFITILIRPVLISMFISIGYYARRICENTPVLARFFMINAESESNKKTIAVKKIIFILIGITLSVICLIFSRVNNGADVRTMAFRNVFFFLLCALTGSFGMIIFCKGLPRIKLLCFWGTGSLIFMATHNSQKVLLLAHNIAMYVNQYLTRARGYICYFIIISVIVLYSSLMIVLIKKFAPFIIGQSYRKK